MKFFIALLSSAFLLTACETGSLDGDGSVLGTGVGYGADSGTGAYGEGVSPLQEDLAVNVGDRIFFGSDSASLTSEAQATLRLQAEWLKSNPGLNAVIEGHCDERGTREYNIALGERRANSVRKYLSSLGVPASRMSTVSFGKERPAVVGSNASAWAQNRRAVTIVTSY